MLPEHIDRLIDRNPDGCWEWSGYRDDGYGRVTYRGIRYQVHRFVYQRLVGAIPEGLTLDHLCRNRSCVRPDHLEPVTIRENVLRGISPTATNARRTACRVGHPFTAANTIRVRNGRACRECQRQRTRAWRAREAKRGEAA